MCYNLVKLFDAPKLIWLNILSLLYYMMPPPNNNPFDFLDNSPNSGKGTVQGETTDPIQDLLYEIIRVKELIKYYDSIPNDAGKLGASILTELVAEAHKSLVDYDPVLIKKYYDLLQNCD